MIKQLLATVAIAATAFGMNAEKKVLWTAEDAAGYAPDWGTAVMLSVDDLAGVTDGDVISMKVEAVADGWHQLLIQAPRPDEDGGWVAIGGQGGLNAGDIVNVPLIPAISKYVSQYGIAVQGDGGVTIKEITAETGTIAVGPNTIWFGPEKSTWTMYSVRPIAFADVKEGDKIVITYDKESKQSTAQLFFGGWGNLTFATYDNMPFITVDEEKCQITCELVKELASYEQEGKTYDAFALLKENGFAFQGADIIFNEISLVPAGAGEEPSVNYYAVGGFQGWKVDEPAVFTYADGVYTLVAEGASTMKISTAAGNWDDFNAATIGPDGAAVDGVMPYTTVTNHEFVLDYQANWTVTIDPTNKTIKFATEDARPAVDIYLRGGMNEWGTSDDWKFSTTDCIIFTLSGVNIESGVSFKVADSSWGSINYGTSEAVAPNTPTVLLYSGGDIKLTESVENAIVVFNLDDKTLTVYTPDGVNAIGSDNGEAVYYNLQGVKVANPTEGNIYIVKKGSKVSKAVF